MEPGKKIELDCSLVFKQVMFFSFSYYNLINIVFFFLTRFPDCYQ